MVSCVIFKSFSHFEFIFVHGVRVCSNFIALHAAVQVSQDATKGWEKEMCDSMADGVPIVAQQVKNLTRIHEDTNLIPGPTQWVKDLMLS